MCRLAAFPKNFKRSEAIDILLNFEGNNTDGVGYAYVENGRFVVKKWAQPLSKVLKRHGNNFLSHLKNHGGITIAHLRAASHGVIHKDNTHPFVIGKGEWCIAHNGIWSDYKVAKLILQKSIKLNGETDSEVAANVIDLISPKKFASGISGGGVYLCLNLNGSLEICKTSGDLELLSLKNKTVCIASEFNKDKYPRVLDA